MERALDVLTALKFLYKKIKMNQLDSIRIKFFSNTIRFMMVLFITRLTIATSKENNSNNKFLELSNKEMKEFDQFKSELILTLKDNLEASLFVLKYKTVIIERLKKLGINVKSVIYLYCCGPICEYFQLLIQENFNSKLYVVDDKVNLINESIISFDEIDLKESDENYFILCNQQDWINQVIKNKILNKYVYPDEQIIFAKNLIDIQN